MTGINCKSDTKDEYNRLKPDEYTNDEFVQELLETYANADESVTIDVDAIVEEITHTVASEVELSAYRGCSEALEDIQ